MHCVFCQHPSTRVIDSRRSPDNSLRRRRECQHCGRRFTTYERVEHYGLLVVKKDGAREAYSREKLRRGVLRACEKLPISSERIDALVLRVEQRLFERGKGEVSSRLVGSLVMRELRKLHKVAYIRFAAVYREFAELADFEQELQRLLRRARK